jgi:hypothetical protein
MHLRFEGGAQAALSFCLEASLVKGEARVSANF